MQQSIASQKVPGVLNPATPPSRPTYGGPSAINETPPALPSINYNQGYQYGMGSQRPTQSTPYGALNSRPPAGPRSYQTGGPTFRNTPFYEIRSRLGDVKTCDGASKRRSTSSPRPWLVLTRI